MVVAALGVLLCISRPLQAHEPSISTRRDGEAAGNSLTEWGKMGRNTEALKGKEEEEEEEGKEGERERETETRITYIA